MTPNAYGVSDALARVTKSIGGPQMARVAKEPLPTRGVTNVSKRWTQSIVAHNSAAWLHNSCHIGDPQRFRVGERIRSGPRAGRMAPKPLKPRDPLDVTLVETIFNGQQVGCVAI